MNTATCEPSPALPLHRYSAKRTRHHVDFFCDAPEAENVRLVGDFNGWDLAATPMRWLPDGRWMATLELHHGHHPYLRTNGPLSPQPLPYPLIGNNLKKT